MGSFRTVVLGNFDGLHRGHQQLIALGRQIADCNQEELAVFTFYPQIQQTFDPNFCYLLTQEEKLERFRRLQVDVVETMPFDKTIAVYTPEEFVQNILVEKLRARHVVVGFNYTFGHRGAGTPQLLQTLGVRYGIQVTVMEPYHVNDQIVSSSAVRTCLREGNVEQANALLGYPYSLQGPVVKGNQIGRTIGFPTANIVPPPHILLPANGVYAAITWVDGQAYPGILNIGMRPTVGQNLNLTVEVNLFQFDGDLYGRCICTEVHHFLRKETKFQSLDALKAQLQLDRIRANQLLAVDR